MYYESFQDMGSEEKAQREWFLKLTSLTAGEFVSLTGPSALRVMVAALSQIQKNGGTADAAGCVEGLWKKVLGFDGPCGPEGCGLPLRAMSFISRLRRSRQHRVSILSAYLVHPFPLRGTSPQGKPRALQDWLSVS